MEQYKCTNCKEEFNIDELIVDKQDDDKAYCEDCAECLDSMLEADMERYLEEHLVIIDLREDR